jgi:hypothetical protein
MRAEESTTRGTGVWTILDERAADIVRGPDSRGDSIRLQGWGEKDINAVWRWETHQEKIGGNTWQAGGVGGGNR